MLSSFRLEMPKSYFKQINYKHTYIDVCDAVGDIPHAELKLAVHQFLH